MTFRMLALNNVLRNWRTYAAYFLSSTFCVMVFFIYAVFAYHPKLSAETLRYASSGMHFAEFIIYVFTFFFILYSMSTFLKTRKKEFGLFMMHGMTAFQLRKLIFIENMALGFFSIMTGIAAGLVFAKGILLLSASVLEMDKPLGFYFPLNALLLTFLAFIGLFLFISLFTSVILRSSKLIDLMKGSEKPRVEPKASVLRSILAVVLLTSGYAIAVLVRGMEVVLAMIPVTIIVIIGTYLLFTQASVYIINKLRNNERIYLKKTNIVTFSDLAFRMKDNARMFFIVAIVSAVAFSSIGTLVGFRSFMLNGTKQQEMFAFTYVSGESNPMKAEHQQVIEKNLKHEQFSYSKLEAKYKIAKFEGKNYTLIKKSDYNRFARHAGADELPADEKGISIMPVSLIYGQEINRNIYNTPIHLKGMKQEIKTERILQRLVYPGSIQRGDGLIVPDGLYPQLSGNQKNLAAYDVKEEGKTVAVAHYLESVIVPPKDDSYSFSSLALKLQQSKQSINVFLFVGLFIGIVFFASAGSFLYFRLYSDFEVDSVKYKAISKLGLTSKELAKIVSAQMGVLFFVPTGVAIVHGLAALIALSHMFNTQLWAEIGAVLGSFTLIQISYFLLIRVRYVRNLKKALQ